MSTDSPAVLTPTQNDAWNVMLPAFFVLPGALDTQMQRNHGLTYASFLALSTLADAPERSLRMRVLASLSSMSMSRLSHLSDRLEEAGYIERRPIEADRRSTLAVLTDAGEKLVLEARGTEATTLRTLVFAKLSGEQVRALREAFTLISSRMDPEERGLRGR